MYIGGKNVIQSAITNNVAIKKVYIWHKFKDDFIISALQKRGITIKYIDKTFLNKFADKNHQGIIIDIDDYQYADLDDFLHQKDGLIVILDHVVDPQNLGAIIRSCEAFKISGIIIPKDRSAKINETVIRASSGGVWGVKIAQETNLSQTINLLKQHDYWIIGADLNGSKPENIDFCGNIALVLGNEGFGISKSVAKKCDFFITIPMLGTVNSLNVSVATGILIYEAQRRREK